MPGDVTFYKNAVIKILDELPAEEISEVFTFATFLRSRGHVQVDQTHGIAVKAIPADQLRPLIGLVALGGDAVEDTERLYES